jgi:hypothetical protein
MDPILVRELETELEEWLNQGYQLLADEVEGELRLTIVYVARAGAVGKEREQVFWPLVPETVAALESRGIPVQRESPPV